MSNPSTLSVRRPSTSKAQAIDRDPLAGKDRYDVEHRVLAKIKKSPRFLMRELFDFFQGRADCFPSNSRISEVSGISPRNVQYLLRDLEELELIKSVEDLSIPGQRRLVLLDHPHALATLKALNALPEWIARIACPPGPRPATVAPPGTQKRAMGDATAAPESSSSKPGNGNRVFKALRGMGGNV